MLLVFFGVSTPRPNVSGPVEACAVKHWSNIQLTRVELSTLATSTTRLTSDKSIEKPRFHILVSELEACGRVETRKGGRDEPKVDIATKIYNRGQPVDG